MPGHESRWCKFSIEYTDPATHKVWKKEWAKEVQSDGDINTFKRACQNAFLAVYPGQLAHAKTDFKDGFKNQPPNTKAMT
jgi:hypothetical protein